MDRNTQQPGPLVSVVMPVYNTEAYVEEAIRSVINQTEQNWELIIVDDHSTDGTAAVIKKYSSADGRIRPLYLEKNGGVSNARNRALDICRGEYIALIDSDDIWLKNKLECQLRSAKKTNADIIYTSYRLDDLSDESRSRDYLVPVKTDYESMLSENFIGCSTVMLRSASLGGRRFSTDIYHEDYALWLCLLREGCTAVGCREVLVRWRILKNARSFNKRAAAKNRWIIYRKVEKLPLTKAARAFLAYAYRGLVKHKRF